MVPIVLTPIGNINYVPEKTSYYVYKEANLTLIPNGKLFI
jgi:hypothetical protein